MPITDYPADSAGGVSKSFIAGEDLLKGDLVKIKNELAYKLISEKYNLKLEDVKNYNGYSSNPMSDFIAFEIDTDTYALFYEKNNDEYLRAAKVENNRVFFGAEKEVSVPRLRNNFDYCSLGNGKALYVCSNNISSNDMFAYVITLNDDLTLDLGSENQLPTGSYLRRVELEKVQDDKVIIYYRENVSNTTNHYAILNITGTTVTKTGVVNLGTGLSNCVLGYVADGKIVSVEQTTGNVFNAYILTVTTSISKSAAYEVSTTASGVNNVASDGTNAFLIYNESGYKIVGFEVDGSVPANKGDVYLSDTPASYIRMLIKNGTLAIATYLDSDGKIDIYEITGKVLEKKAEAKEILDLGIQASQMFFHLTDDYVVTFSQNSTTRKARSTVHSFNNYDIGENKIKGQATNAALETETVTVSIV